MVESGWVWGMETPQDASLDAIPWGEFEIYSNCDNPAEWIQDSGSWTIDGTITKTAGDDHALRYHRPLEHSYRQFGKYKIVSWTRSANYPYHGILMRSGASSGWRYFLWGFDDDTAHVSTFDWNTWDENPDVEYDIMFPDFAADIWCGFEVEGIGNDTVWRFWTWSSDPGNRSDWGTAQSSLIGNPSNPANNGLYVGICQATTAVGVISVDQFYAGSSGVAP